MCSVNINQTVPQKTSLSICSQNPSDQFVILTERSSVTSAELMARVRQLAIISV